MGMTKRSFWAMALPAAALLLAGGQAQADVLAQWIQIGPGGFAGGSSTATAAGTAFNATASLSGNTILARAIVTVGDACPALMIDGKPAATQMSVRFSNTTATSTGTFAEPTTSGGKYVGMFPVTECEAVVPPGHGFATIGEVRLRLPVDHPQRILVIGDTGCRMSGTGAQQDCNDPESFPLAYLASFEAQFQPDLIIHVGDYFYRDTSCSGVLNSTTGVTSSTCATPGSADYEPWGDNWTSWNGDLFTPAKALLNAAPWVMARGNHESCGRGSLGWFTLLDPHPYNAKAVECAPGAFDVGTASAYTAGQGNNPYGFDFEPSYIVPIGKVQLIVHDSSYANDAAVAAPTASRYQDDMNRVLASLGSAPAIFATHKPSFGLVNGAPTNGGDFTEQYMFTNLLNSGSGVPMNIGLLLSGHIHQFEYINFQDYTRYAPQMVVGVGGSLLDPETVPPNVIDSYTSQGFTVHSSTSSSTTATVTKGYSQDEFGFALLTATGTGYTAAVYNIGSNRAGRCTITMGPALKSGTTRGIDCNM